MIVPAAAATIVTKTTKKMIQKHVVYLLLLSALCLVSFKLLDHRFRHELFDPPPENNTKSDNNQSGETSNYNVRNDEESEMRLRILRKLDSQMKTLRAEEQRSTIHSPPAFRPITPQLLRQRISSQKGSNNSNESGVLIYNKVPKASSTTFVAYLKTLSRMNGFIHDHVPIKHYFNATKNQEIGFLRHHYVKRYDGFYSSDQHIMFINAEEDYQLSTDERPNWIQLVREPIERLISEFYFKVFREFQNYQRKGSHYNFQLTYFCGSSLTCQEGGNRAAIQRAKFNVEAYYSVVGLSHDLKRSFELLEALLPAYFSGASTIFRENLRLNGNDHEPMKNASILNAMIKSPAMQGELEFYGFIRQRFEMLYERFVLQNRIKE